VQFTCPESTDVWLPVLTSRLENPRAQAALTYRVVARLRPNVTLEQARDDLARVTTDLGTDFSRTPGSRRIWLEPVHEYVVGAERPAVQLLTAIAALVFVVSCLNVAALLLAQMMERKRELAVQLTLGAGRWRIARQLLAESTVMAAIAAAGSLTVVGLFQPMLRAAMPPGTPRLDEIGIDPFMLVAFTALIALAIVFSTIVPGWRGSTINPGAEIVMTSRTATQARNAAHWRRGLVAAQIAVVMVLLVTGTLLLHSFWNLRQVDLGFDGERVFTAEMRLLDRKYIDEARLKSFQSDLLARVRSLPGVERASITSSVPMRGVDWTRLLPNGAVAKERDVDSDYFAVMGIPLLAGRTFTEADAASAPLVSIVSRSLALKLFGGRSPLGQMLDLNDRMLQIVGVVADVRNISIDSAGDPAYYIPRAQQSSTVICLVARTAAGAPDIGPAVRAIVSAIDPTQPIFNATTISGIVANSIADRRFYSLVTAAFAIITLLIAAGGLYGITAYGVAARMREIGIRTALGAEPRRIVAMLIEQEVRPVVAGLVLGVTFAFWTERLLQRFLFEVSGRDPLTYGGAAIWILLLTVAACVVPAARATAANPTVALRAE
jgi:putative ABC transport system permease protein